MNPRVAGWPSSIRPAGQVPAYAVGGGPVAVSAPYLPATNLFPGGGDIVRNGIISFSPSDAQIAHFLGTHGYTCGSWERLTLQKKRIAAGGGGDAFVRLIDAYCLKLAIQAQNAPRTARPLAIIRPAGQAVAVGASVSGLLGIAVGVGVGYLAYKKHWF